MLVQLKLRRVELLVQVHFLCNSLATPKGKKKNKTKIKKDKITKISVFDANGQVCNIKPANRKSKSKNQLGVELAVMNANETSVKIETGRFNSEAEPLKLELEKTSSNSKDKSDKSNKNQRFSDTEYAKKVIQAFDFKNFDRGINKRVDYGNFNKTFSHSFAKDLKNEKLNQDKCRNYIRNKIP